jgi:hypothetical protein
MYWNRNGTDIKIPKYEAINSLKNLRAVSFSYGLEILPRSGRDEIYALRIQYF